MEIWIVSSLGLLRKQWLWTFLYKSFRGHMFSFLLGKYPEIEFLGHGVDIGLTLWETARSVMNVTLMLLFDRPTSNGLLCILNIC